MINLTTVSVSTINWMCSRHWTPLATRNRVSATVPAHRYAAFHQAYRHFAQSEPTWVQRRFDDAFLRPFLIGRGARPTALELAWAWDKQFGVLYAPPLRLRQVAELTAVATQFLQLLAKENAQ